MAVERKTLKSVSEFSIFKYLLVFYLVFFVIALIVSGIIFLVTWLGFSAAGVSLNELLPSLGLDMSWLPGGNAAGIALMIIGGLIGSVVIAAIGTLAMWIVNIVLKISGGIELRFLGTK